MYLVDGRRADEVRLAPNRERDGRGRGALGARGRRRATKGAVLVVGFAFGGFHVRAVVLERCASWISWATRRARGASRAVCLIGRRGMFGVISLPRGILDLDFLKMVSLTISLTY